MKFLRNAVPLFMIAAALVFSGCHWNDVSDSGGDDGDVKISSLSFAKSTLSISPKLIVSVSALSIVVLTSQIPSALSLTI